MKGRAIHPLGRRFSGLGVAQVGPPPKWQPVEDALAAYIKLQHAIDPDAGWDQTASQAKFFKDAPESVHAAMKNPTVRRFTSMTGKQDKLDAVNGARKLDVQIEKFKSGFMADAKAALQGHSSLIGGQDKINANTTEPNKRAWLQGPSSMMGGRDKINASATEPDMWEDIAEQAKGFTKWFKEHPDKMPKALDPTKYPADEVVARAALLSMME